MEPGRTGRAFGPGVVVAIADWFNRFRRAFRPVSDTGRLRMQIRAVPSLDRQPSVDRPGAELVVGAHDRRERGVGDLGRLLGGGEQLDLMLVERVDQGDEAPGLVPLLRPHLGNADDDHRMIDLGNGEVVRRAAVLSAQALEFGLDGSVLQRMATPLAGTSSR